MNKLETVPVAECPESASSEIPMTADSPAGESAVAETNSSEPASEDILLSIEEEIARRQNEATAIETDIIPTQQALNAAREKLGLPPGHGETVPSIVGRERRLKAIRRELAVIRETRRTLIETRERERLLHEEKECLLHEVINTLAHEFEVYKKNDPKNFCVLTMDGTLLGGARYESHVYGAIDPDILKSVLVAFGEGRQALNDLLSAAPRLAEQFDALVSEEANRRVKRMMELRHALEQQFAPDENS